jgi:hypothetical protein
MSRSGIGWRAWAAVVSVAVVVLLLVLLLFRLPPLPGSPESRMPAGSSAAPVGLVRLQDQEDRLLREDATLRDPTPLFLPTRWNAAENALTADARRGAGLSSFGGYSAKLSFPETAVGLQLPAVVTVPARPAESLGAGQSTRPLQGLGETDEPAPSLEPRAAFIEVVTAADGHAVIAHPLRDARPPGEVNWQPLEFLIAVDRSGVVRPPVLTTSSRFANVDAYFQEYLAKELHLGARLTPGFYRVCFGP